MNYFFVNTLTIYRRSTSIMNKSKISIEDAKLLELASDRMENFDPKTLKDANEVYAELNISQKTLDEMDDVEIE